MFLIFLFSKRLAPRYAALVTLVAGILIARLSGSLHFEDFHIVMGAPVFTMPEFSSRALIGIGLPLFVVTMASQNIPGVAVLRGAGYSPPISPLITWTGITNIFTALFGGFALNLAAITAAICMGREAHEDKDKRYLAAVSAGFFYLIVGVFAATVTALFQAFPKELVLSIAGLALLGTIANSLETAVRDAKLREPALITFLVSASGLSLLGIGAAFWGLVAGLIAWSIAELFFHKQ
jgi:benzoate membrane transport protein